MTINELMDEITDQAEEMARMLPLCQQTEIALWNALRATREESGGIPLSDVAKIIKDTLAPEEVESLVNELENHD